MKNANVHDYLELLRRASWLLCVVCVSGWATPALAAPDVIPASTHVIAVPDATHIVVGHGRKDLFPADGKGLRVSPRPLPRAERKTPPVEFGVVIALADVERVDETTALLRIRDAKQSPKVGDHVTWSLTLPKAAAGLRTEPLFWAALLDIGVRPGDADDELFVLRDFIADPTRVQAVTRAMVAEIRRYSGLAAQVYADPIDSGSYRGRTLQDVFARTTEADVQAFWDYVVSDAWNYMTYSFRLIEVYATWVVRGSPQGPSVKTQRALATGRIELAQVLRRQDWEAAERLLIELLRIVPGDKTLREELDLVGIIRRSDAALLRDPTDDEAAWLRAAALADLGHQTSAILAFEKLIVRGYRVDDARRKLGYALCGAGRWEECERLFGQLIAERGKRRAPDADLEKWHLFARTRGNQGGNDPTADASAQIATARALEGEGAWSMAISSWRNAITLARAANDVASLQEAQLGLTRATRRAAMVDAVAAGVGLLEGHRLEDAVRVVATVRASARELGDPAAGAIELGAMTTKAREVGEQAFAETLANDRLADVPMPCGTACVARGSVLADLAEMVSERDPVRAEALFAEAIKLAPGDVTVRAKRSWFFAEMGRWSDAYSAAFMGTGQSIAMAYTIVRANAARAKFDDAVEMADRLGHQAQELGLIAAAVHRLAQVHKELLAAGPAGSEHVARLVLRRIRSLADIGLERVAMVELAALAPFPELQREGAWAIASPRTVRPTGADLFPLSERSRAAEMALGPHPSNERRRRFEVLSRRQAWVTTPTNDTRLALAKALLVDGRLHEAWALAQGLDAALADKARAAVRGYEVLTHARQARERGDPVPQRTLADDAARAFDGAGVPARALDAQLLVCEALVALGQQKDAYRPVLTGLVAARADGNPERIRAFEALLAKVLGKDPGALSDAALLELAKAPVDAPRPSLDRYEQTLRLHLRQCVALDDDRCVALTHEELGLVAIQRGKVTDARGALDEAVRGFETQCDGPRARRATMAIARVHRLRSELALAANKAEEVLDAAVTAGDGSAEREALLELGSLALAQGDLGAARKWLAAATDAAQRGNDGLAIARVDASRGRAELLLGGDLAVAVGAFERAMQRFEQLGATGDALGVRIDLAEALVLMAGAAPAGKKIDRPTTQAAASRALKLMSDAPKLAASLGRDVLQLRALLASAAARVATRETAIAEPLLASASTLAQKTELDDLLARTRHLEAKVALADGRRDDAARISLEAARGLAKPLASGTLPLGRAETQDVFQQAADLLFELGRHDDALELLELQRTVMAARTFDLEALRRSANPELAAELARYADAKARADAVSARLREDADAPDAGTRDDLIKLAAASQRELAPLAERLAREHPAHWKTLARDPESLASERKKLPKGTILVEYFTTSDALYLFVVRPLGTAAGGDTASQPVSALRVAITTAELADTITRYRKLVTTDGRLAEPLSRELYAWLVAPVANLVPAAERAAATLILLPQGPLLDVPFSALVSSPEGSTLRYVLHDWRLAVASATTLAPLLAGPRKLAVFGPVLGLADPDGTLPEARKELDGLPASLKPTVLRGPEATEAKLLELSPSHRILHFATHGLLAPNPLDSALVLASGDLAVARIAGLAGLRGKVALVFLSACRSSDVATVDGEALSLAEAFALAGVPTLVGSLWDVDDRATRVLVEGFYKALAARSGDTLQALRSAQLALLETSAYAEPRFWSAFQLIGDFR